MLDRGVSFCSSTMLRIEMLEAGEVRCCLTGENPSACCCWQGAIGDDWNTEEAGGEEGGGVAPAFSLASWNDFTL